MWWFIAGVALGVVLFFVVYGVRSQRSYVRARSEILRILGNLGDGEELFGLEIVERSEGKLSRASIYVWLGRMQDDGSVASRYVPSYLSQKGYIVEDRHGDRPPDPELDAFPRRRLYRLANNKDAGETQNATDNHS